MYYADETFIFYLFYFVKRSDDKSYQLLKVPKTTARC